MKYLLSLHALAFLAVGLAAALPSPARADEGASTPLPIVAAPCLMPGMLGTAIIQEDQTIILTYRGPRPDQTGFAELTYRPGTPDYDAVALHIGDIQPGQIKQIAPWQANTDPEALI